MSAAFSPSSESGIAFHGSMDAKIILFTILVLRLPTDMTQEYHSNKALTKLKSVGLESVILRK